MSDIAAFGAAAIPPHDALPQAAAPAASLQKAKILFVLSALGAGGAERVTTGLCNHFSRRGVDVAIATFESPGARSYYPLDDAVTVHRLGAAAARQPVFAAIRQTLSRVGALSALIRHEQPTVVISFLTKINVIALLAAPKGPPVIVSERNNPQKQEINALWRMARAMTFPKAAAFVAMTQGAIDAYPKQLRPNATVIPNPVIIPDGVAPRGGGRTLTAVGRLTRQKRFDLLLDAFARVAGDYPDWRLIIWGEGEDRASLEAQRDRLGLAGRVTMPGLSAAPGAWLETADVFVLCSDFEGWGNVVAESMAAGLPVISTDCDFGPREMITDGVSGLLVPCNDAEALAEGLSRLLGDAALRARLAEAAKVRASAFGVEAIAHRWESLAAAAIERQSR